MQKIAYKELKEEHGLSNKQIQKFGRMAQKHSLTEVIFLKTLIQIKSKKYFRNKALFF